MNENNDNNNKITLILGGIALLAGTGLYYLRKTSPEYKRTEPINRPAPVKLPEERIVPVDEVPAAARTLVRMRSDGKRNIDKLRKPWKEFWFNNATLEKVGDAATKSGWKASPYKSSIPLKLILNQRNQESGGLRFAVSSVGAMGPHQFMPATAKEMFTSNPQAVWSGPSAATQATTLIGRMYKDYKKLGLNRNDALIAAILGYNWGWGYTKSALKRLHLDVYAVLNEKKTRTWSKRRAYVRHIAKGVGDTSKIA